MRRSRSMLLVIAALLALACGDRLRDRNSDPTSQTTVTAGLTPGEFQHDGLTRTYRLFVPEGIEGTMPLVVALHGGLGSGEQFAGTTGYDTVAEREGFAVVYPDGVNRTWNGGRCCGRAMRDDLDDVGFLAALIEWLASEVPIDAARVYMTGHSNGAIMTFRFACERAELVAAIAPVAGSLEIPDCPVTRGVSLLAIHGDSDRNHPLEGGEGDRSLAGVPFTSLADSMATWTEAMGCGEAGQPEIVGALATTDWPDCREGTISRAIIIAGADHPWPGGEKGASQIQGEPSQELDATEASWEFFAETFTALTE